MRLHGFRIFHASARSPYVPRQALGLDISGNTGDNHARAAWALPESGKYYWEVTATTVTAASYQGFGIAHSTYNINTSGLATDGSKMYVANGKKYHDPDDASWGDTFDDGDVISIAVDMDAGKIWAAKNGTWQASGNPATGANPMYDNFLAYSTNKQWHPSFHSFQNGAAASFNFGQRAFSHTVPTGYGPLSVATIPEPTIKNGREHFNSILYTANATTDRALTGVGFSPNLFWAARRNAAGAGAMIFDTVRGATKELYSPYTSAAGTEAESLKSFDADGVTLGNTWPNATNSDTWVAWTWKESVSAGFDIITYEGDGVAGRTVAHNLGVAPNFIVVKDRDASRSWAVGTDSSWDKNLRWEDANGLRTTDKNSTQWYETAPTSSVFYVGDRDAGDY